MFGEWHTRTRSSAHIYMSGSPVVVYPSNGEFRTTSALNSVGTVVYLVLW